MCNVSRTRRNSRTATYYRKHKKIFICLFISGILLLSSLYLAYNECISCPAKKPFVSLISASCGPITVDVIGVDGGTLGPIQQLPLRGQRQKRTIPGRPDSRYMGIARDTKSGELYEMYRYKGKGVLYNPRTGGTALFAFDAADKSKINPIAPVDLGRMDIRYAPQSGSVVASIVKSGFPRPSEPILSPPKPPASPAPWTVAVMK